MCFLQSSEVSQRQIGTDMKRIISSLAVGAFALAGVATAAEAANAVTAANTQHAVYQSDFVPAASGTGSSGAYGFGPKGLVVETKDASSNAKVAEFYTPTATTLPTRGSYAYDGTSSASGANVSDQIIFDGDGVPGSLGADGKSNDYNVLVGEQIYSTGAPGSDLTDWWYTGGTTRAAARGFTCPSTTAGSGSDCHGTLAQWDALFPKATTSLIGFSLGSGVQANGVLSRSTFDTADYVYTPGSRAVPVVTPTPTPTPIIPAPTTAPATATADVTGDFVSLGKQHKVVFNLTADPLAPNTTEGARLTWTVKVGGKSIYTVTQDACQTNTFGVTNFVKHKAQGHRKTVKLYKNGVKVAVATLDPQLHHGRRHNR